MKADDDAVTRANGCAAALRALDAYEAAVYPTDPHDKLYGREKPADLQRIRDKLRANAYASEWHWMDDLRCMFGYFGNTLPESVRERMAEALFNWIDALWRLELFGRTAANDAQATHWWSKIKQLEPAFFADQEARKAAARASSSSAAPAAAAAPAPNAAMAMNHPTAAASTAAAISPIATVSATATALATKPMSAGSVAPRRAGDEKAVHKENAACPPVASVIAAPATASALGTAAAAAPVSLPAMAPAAASAGASAVASASASSSKAENAKTASLVASMRGPFDALIEHAEQLERNNAQLQRELNARTTELASAQRKIAAASSHFDRLITVKQEKFDAIADAYGAAQQAAKATTGKRKAESELESEAKRRRALEGDLAALSEQMDEKDKCIVCLDKQPDVLFLRCRHLVCCSGCAGSIVHRGAAGATCPQCQMALVAKDVIKVFRA
jgi:hypothetical protein